MPLLRYPSIETYRKQMMQADSEDDKSRDVRPLFETLMMFPQLNPRIRGHILTRKTAVSSWDWSIEPMDKSEQKRAEQVKARLNNIITDIIGQRVQTPLFGAFALALDWQRQSEAVPVVKKRYLPTEFDIGNNGAYVYADKNSNQKNFIEKSEFFLLESDGEFYRGGLLRSIGIAELMRYDMMMEWGNYNRKQKGLIQGIDKGADDQERSVAVEAIKTAAQHNYMLTSDLIDFKFHQFTSNTAGASFKEMIESLNNAIAIAILGQANTPELPKGGGSRAALQVQQMVSADIMFSDVFATEKLINGQLLYWDAINNYGKPPAWKFKIELAEAVDLEATASYLEIASRFIQLDTDDVYGKLGLKIPAPNNALPRTEET